MGPRNVNGQEACVLVVTLAAAAYVVRSFLIGEEGEEGCAACPKPFPKETAREKGDHA